MDRYEHVHHRVRNLLLDPGWPYLLAGLLMLLAAGLIPSGVDLEEREANLAGLRSELEEANRLHAAYGVFLDEIACGDQSLVRRLVSAQLGLVPAGEAPVAVCETLRQSPARWIERSATGVEPSPLDPGSEPAVPVRNASVLSGFVAGDGRLWLFAGALVVIFLGLLLNPDPDQDRGAGPCGR